MEEPRFLVTGSTGFLGGALLEQWATSGLPGRALLLVRAGGREEARSRVRSSVVRYGGRRAAELVEARTDVVVGDLGSPTFLADPRLDGVTHVVHLAANTSFLSSRGVHETNVDATLAFARRLARSPALKRLLYVGTAWICGDAPPRLVGEDDYPCDGVRHIVRYTASKAEAESGLAALRLPLVVARPSIVVGHTQLGCRPSGSLFWAFRALDALGWIAWPEWSRIDVVPVDWAAAVLLRLLFANTLRYSRYHVSAGRASSVTWAEIGYAFGREGHGGSYERKELSALQAERARFERLFGPCDARRMRRALDLYYRFAARDVVFDNGRLREEGFPSPPRFAHYLGRCRESPAGLAIAEQMMADA